MPEYPRASSQPDYAYDYDLWFAVGEDPMLYVYALRMQGRRTPTWIGGGIMLPNPPAELRRVIT